MCLLDSPLGVLALLIALEGRSWDDCCNGQSRGQIKLPAKPLATSDPSVFHVFQPPSVRVPLRRGRRARPHVPGDASHQRPPPANLLAGPPGGRPIIPRNIPAAPRPGPPHIPGTVRTSYPRPPCVFTVYDQDPDVNGEEGLDINRGKFARPPREK